MLNVDDKFNSAVKKMSLTGQWQFWSSLLKMSLTGQWQFLRQSHWELVKAENHWLIILIMDIPLMAKCHWPQSMTKIYGQNFKKNVIDHGQWQKNCHLLKVIYPILDVNFFYLEPVRGIAKRWQVVMDSPMARGAEPWNCNKKLDVCEQESKKIGHCIDPVDFGQTLTLSLLFSSAAEAKTTSTNTMVMRNSTPKA